MNDYLPIVVLGVIIALVRGRCPYLPESRQTRTSAGHNETGRTAIHPYEWAGALVSDNSR